MDGEFPRYNALLSAADEIHVTGDSVSMLSEAVVAGKPVGLIPLELNPIGKIIRLAEMIRGQRSESATSPNSGTTSPRAA